MTHLMFSAARASAVTSSSCCCSCSDRLPPTKIPLIAVKTAAALMNVNSTLPHRDSRVAFATLDGTSDGGRVKGNPGIWTCVDAAALRWRLWNWGCCYCCCQTSGCCCRSSAAALPAGLEGDSRTRAAGEQHTSSGFRETQGQRTDREQGVCATRWWWWGGGVSTLLSMVKYLVSIHRQHPPALLWQGHMFGLHPTQQDGWVMYLWKPLALHTSPLAMSSSSPACNPLSLQRPRTTHTRCFMGLFPGFTRLPPDNTHTPCHDSGHMGNVPKALHSGWAMSRPSNTLTLHPCPRPLPLAQLQPSPPAQAATLIALATSCR